MFQHFARVTMPAEETPLEDVPGLTPDVRSRLRALWISTAEQLVALAATPRGSQSLAEQLELTTDEIDAIVGEARRALPPDVAAEMGSAVDPSELPLGAVRPPNKPAAGDG